jgi:hypothetical protein
MFPLKQARDRKMIKHLSSHGNAFFLLSRALTGVLRDAWNDVKIMDFQSTRRRRRPITDQILSLGGAHHFSFSLRRNNNNIVIYFMFSTCVPCESEASVGAQRESCSMPLQPPGAEIILMQFAI